MGEHKYSDEESEELRELAEKIVYYRTKINKAQEEVALEVGIEKSNYQPYEYGKMNMKYLVLKKIAKALNITVDKLVKPQKKKSRPRQTQMNQ